MKRQIVWMLAAALGAFSVTACSDATAPNDSGAAADATTAGALVAVDAAQEGIDQMVLPVGSAPNRTVTYYDAAGKTQDKYDSLTTASMRIKSVMDHTSTRTGFSATIHRESDMTVSGLAGRETTRTWNGTSSGKVTESSQTTAGGTRSYTMTESETTSKVVRGVDPKTQPWPLSGTITHKVTVVSKGGPKGDVNTDVTTVTTFNGTQHPTVTVNGVAKTVDLGDRHGPAPFGPTPFQPKHK